MHGVEGDNEPLKRWPMRRILSKTFVNESGESAQIPEMNSRFPISRVSDQDSYLRSCEARIRLSSGNHGPTQHSEGKDVSSSVGPERKEGNGSQSFWGDVGNSGVRNART